MRGLLCVVCWGGADTTVKSSARVRGGLCWYSKEWIWSATLVLAKTVCCIKFPKLAQIHPCMISQHMYYINNPLFYISQSLVIHVHRRCNAIDVLQNN